MKGIEMKKQKRLGTVFAAVLCMLALFAAPAFARQNGSITIRDSRANGLTLKLYRVAAVDGDLTAFTETKRAYRKVIMGLPFDSAAHTDAWRRAAKKLDSQIRSGKIAPDKSGTVANGSLVFADLPQGLYLMTGDKTKVNRKTIIPSPTLIAVPTRASSNAAWQYFIRVDGLKLIEPGKTPSPVKPKKTPKRLPQTGQLWWPVWVMAAAGGALLAAGLVRRKQEQA